jgi:hypothetical protein
MDSDISQNPSLRDILIPVDVEQLRTRWIETHSECAKGQRQSIALGLDVSLLAGPTRNEMACQLSGSDTSQRFDFA